jgi:hypothetical protein
MQLVFVAGNSKNEVGSLFGIVRKQKQTKLFSFELHVIRS